jgi:hypothetical protein
MSSEKQGKPWYEKHGPSLSYVQNDILNKYKGNIIKDLDDCKAMKKIIAENITESLTFNSFMEYKKFYMDKNNKYIQTILKEYNMYLCEKTGVYKNHVYSDLQNNDDDVIVLNNFDMWNKSKK